MKLSRRQLLATLPALTASSAPAAARPNVIVVLTDDQGYGDLSCHGNTIIKTPNMDKLHGESVRFTSFHVAPMCTPTRGQLMSGMDALRNGATSVTAGRAFLRRGIPTMADIFARNGYRTGIFGKWHLGDNYPYRPNDRGFHEAKYHLGFGLSSAPEFSNDYFDGSYHHNGVRKRFDGYCTDFWFREAMNWIGERGKAKEPFLCYLPTNAPHGPLWVDEKWAAPYRDKPGVPANFFGMIANIDYNLGLMDDFLRRNGLRENTIFIFMTDNGATGGCKLYNSGMRGCKTENYEGGHRVPCFVRWPAGGLRTAVDVPTIANVQDILPTLVDLCGIKDTLKARFDGSSLSPYLKGAGDPLADRILIVQYGQIPKKYDAAVMWGKWRLVGGAELYNMQADPGQTANVAAANAAVVKRLRDHYDGWWADVEPRLREFAPVTLGAPQANPVLLSSSDWEGVYCDNPAQVANAAPKAIDGAPDPRGGPWNVVVQNAGSYEIALSRWPFDMGLRLTDIAPEHRNLPRGVALPIAGAHLTVAGESRDAKTAPNDKEAVFRLPLKAGRTKLHGWFVDAAGKPIAGAFFARVRSL